ncbi:GIDE domain-containing protein [Pseudonocardia pini]|uniref:GIDE domain-containing protein n=1 Tax=Pseudonocardia pini TaxID=2758030 RepID=UPI0015F03723|nr:GIDE domain-containing protein [Pseudonocardia pini]
MASTVLLVLTGVLGYLAYTQIRVVRDSRTTWLRGLEAAPTGIAEVVAMAEAARAGVGSGAFGQVVALTGTVAGETRSAALSGVPSVWYRVETLRRYRTDKGSAEEVVGQQRGQVAFTLRDGDAEVVVDPRDATVDVPAADVREEGPDPDEGITLGPLRIGGRTLGYRHTEWRIEPGERITVIGEARDTGSGVRLAVRPEQTLTLTTAERGDHVHEHHTRNRAAVPRAVAYSVGAVAAFVGFLLL